MKVKGLLCEFGKRSRVSMKFSLPFIEGAIFLICIQSTLDEIYLGNYKCVVAGITKKRSSHCQCHETTSIIQAMAPINEGQWVEFFDEVARINIDVTVMESKYVSRGNQGVGLKK